MNALAWIEEQTEEEAPEQRPRLRAVGEGDERRQRTIGAILAEGLVPLRRMALRWVRKEDADDLVQDTLERALRAVDRFDEHSNVQAWLRTIMYHVAVDRSRQRARRRTECHIQDLPTEPEEPPPAWSAISVEQVRAAAERLSAPLRVAYRLHVEENLSYEQMSVRMAVPLGTVATRLYRARLQLRRLLEQDLEMVPAASAQRSQSCGVSW
jgi:RNA polymerase sigma-70 factor (ECF subfamily)